MRSHLMRDGYKAEKSGCFRWAPLTRCAVWQRNHNRLQLFAAYLSDGMRLSHELETQKTV
jgi:hypothetical protein